MRLFTAACATDLKSASVGGLDRIEFDDDAGVVVLLLTDEAVTVELWDGAADDDCVFVGNDTFFVRFFGARFPVGTVIAAIFEPVMAGFVVIEVATAGFATLILFAARTEATAAASIEAVTINFVLLSASSLLRFLGFSVDDLLIALTQRFDPDLVTMLSSVSIFLFVLTPTEDISEELMAATSVLSPAAADASSLDDEL
jgi:hypothetical protein